MSKFEVRIGIIDLGTNSVRFDVHLVHADGQSVLLHREKLMIRLGQGVFLDGKLDPHAIRRTLQAFMGFRRIADQLHVQQIVAFGTSALREANDAESLIDSIRKKTSIDIRVISGEEEAQLISLGILSHEQPREGKFGLLDIGGGSTEISICQKTRVLHSASLPLGTARIQQVFLKNSPPRKNKRPDSDPVLSLRHSIKSILHSRDVPTWPKVEKVIGSSGTIRAIEKILRKLEGCAGIHRRSLKKLVQYMSTLSQKELLQIPGMEAKRVDMILAGSILLEECMDAIRATELVTTNYSLRDGILAREVQQLLHLKGHSVQFDLKTLYCKARALGADENHLKQVVRLSEYLFDHTKRLHKLKSDWKCYLSAAAILHDIGKAVTPTHHELHTYYIVRNANFLAMEKWESEFIAQLCLRHNAGKPSKKDLAWLDNKNKKFAFIRLLAILRIADALDLSHKSNIRIHSVKLSKTKITLSVSHKKLDDLDILRTEQKKGLFENVFQRSLVIQRQALE